MDESDKPTKLEALIKIHNEKNQMPLYYGKDHSSSSSPKVLKPHDVIATVSKQLRNIQKADSLKKVDVKHTLRARQSDFVPIYLLSNQEDFLQDNVTKFESQCVTDTQLIGIVDNFEAMFNTNINSFQDVQTTSRHKKECAKKESNKLDDNITVESNLTKEFKQLAYEKTEPCVDVCIPITQPKSLAPLVFPLNLFENFESIAMPLIEQNIDFETAKHLINSQLIDNKLLFTANVVPALQKSTAKLIIEDSKSNIRISELLHNFQNKDGGVETRTDSKQTVNKSLSFEDEILFSSDEENDSFDFCTEDYPMTCALKTSAYESTTDLDDTLFVGFQTSSNKSIQVSKDSFLKAKHMFDNFDKKNNINSTLTELDVIFDCSVSSFDNNLPPKHGNTSSHTYNEKFDNCNENLLKIAKIEHDNAKVLDATKYNGFKTADGKSIDISKEAFQKCKNIFKDIEEDIDIDVFVSNNISNKRELPGIKTASNKKTKVTEECFLSSTNFFKGIEININNRSIVTTGQDETQHENTIESDHLHAISKSDINDDCINIVDQTLLKEFENDSIKESKNKLSEVHYSASQTSVDFKPTETEVNKSQITLKSSVSNSNLSKNFDPGISEYLYNHYPQKTFGFSGFKTANNKDIKISCESLAKTKNIFHDIEFENFSQHNADNNFKSCYNDHNNDKNIAEYANVNENYCRKSTSHQIERENTSIFQGFKTASNKVVKISKEAFLKTEKIFQNIDSVISDDMSTKVKEDLNDNISVCNSFPIHDVNVLRNIVSAPKVVDGTDIFFKNIFKSIDVQVPDRFGDVNTVQFTNSIVDNTNIGKMAHMSSRNLCNDNTNSVRKGENATDSGLQELITTYSDHIIPKVFSKVRQNLKTVDDIEDKHVSNLIVRSDEKEPNDNIITIKPIGFQGFKTASNKEVVISDNALAKSKRVLEDVDCEKKITLHKDKNESSDFAISANMAAKNMFEVINEEKENNTGVFNGFHIASNKCMKISEDALTRSIKMLQEINCALPSSKDKFGKDICFINKDRNKENIGNNCKEEKVLQTFEFKTPTNKCVKISEESLTKSNQFFSDLENNYINDIDEVKLKNMVTMDVNDNTHSDIINTQLLNNFEQTLYTEDFYKDTTPEQCKRSGSPILSCPKAKKRKKFETPYRSDISVSNIPKEVYRTNKTSHMKYSFSENYKITKSYSLSELDKSDNNKLNAVIDPYILNFGFDVLLKFEFEGSRNDFTDVRWTINDIKNCFLVSVNSKIIPEGWLDNHLKLILWKLISYEIRFPNILRGICSVRNVLEQLKYRYDKELYRVERPALRKLLEKDDISTRTMILAVVGVFIDGVKVHSTTSPSSSVELLLTDGWYCIKACTDKMISRLVCDGKIAVGKKIATVGAELLNCEQGVSPWEDTSSVRLKLSGNSTRPARWDARLGYYNNGSILSQLSSIDPLGGKVSKTRAYVVRVYPALYVEKLEDGSTVTRSERLEHLYQMKYETERQNQLEKLYEDVEKEFFDKESSESEGMDLQKSYPSGSQLNRLMKKTGDPSQFTSHLTETEVQLLQEYTSRKKEKIVEELQNRVQYKINERGLHLGRKVIPLLKIRVAGFEGTDCVKVTKAMISIWRPNEAIHDVVKEGAWIDLYNVFPTSVRNSEMQISAGHQSVFHGSKYKGPDKMQVYIDLFQRKCFTTKDLNKYPVRHTDFNEIDTVGVVFLIEPSLHSFETTKGQQFQNVYLTDVDKNFICINFWGGIKKFGYEHIFEAGNVVACSNLQIRAGNTRKCIPQYRATELTIFTKTPRYDHVKAIFEDLIKKISGLDKRKFCNDCIVIKNNYTTMKHSSDFSPYRFNTSEYSLTRNKGFIDSPLVQNKDVNLNLTGLDFESTFKQHNTQELSPAILKRKQLVEERIAKLKLYGEPPPLSEIHIINKSKNADSAYKSPLLSCALNMDRQKKANDSVLANNLPPSSPVMSSNRTYVVKSRMNPVKLNFSTTSVRDNKTEINPFEEEFEASPPLSLD